MLARLDALARTEPSRYRFADIAYAEDAATLMAVLIQQRALRGFQARDHFVWLSTLDRLRRQWEDRCRDERLRARLERDNPRRLRARELFVELHSQKRLSDAAKASLESTLAEFEERE